jgi:F-type H+-transporting ATPase subunit b
MSATTLVLAAAATTKEDSNFLVPNGTFIAELVAFVLLLWAISRYVLPPLSKAMTARQDMIDRSIKDAQEAKERLEAAEAEHKELLEKTKADASRIREEARVEGRAIIEELRAKAQEEADRVRARGEEQLAAEREQVVAALRSDLGRLATELAERIVGESLQDDAGQRRVVDRFLEDLDARESDARESHGAR